MRILEQSGFVSVQRGVKGGPIVKETVLNRIAGLFLDAFKFRKISIEELRTARIDIEKAMLVHVIRNADSLISKSIVTPDISPFELFNRNSLKTKLTLDGSSENIDFGLPWPLRGQGKVSPSRGYQSQPLRGSAFYNPELSKTRNQMSIDSYADSCGKPIFQLVW